MAGELYWGWSIVVHFFLVGLSAGALITSAYLLLRGGRAGTYFQVARYGAFVAPIPVILDGIVVVTELGSFQAGHWFKFLNLYTTVTASPMSIGAWLVVLFIVLSLVYAYTFLAKDAAPGDRFDTLRRTMAWVGMPLAIAVGFYPGMILSVMQSRPLWNSSVLPIVFVLSALSMGIACIVLARILTPMKAGDTKAESEYRTNNYVLTTSNVVVLSTVLLLVFLFAMLAQRAVGGVSEAISVILTGGGLAMAFWLGVVVIGLLVPIIVGLVSVFPRLIQGKEYAVSRAVEVIVPIAVLIGAFILRYVMVVAGQITGPVGI
ncbi:MAG: NrfD/PsrC family molybdoenzyme membrane anchor subunit [Acidiferrobacterales bacterium]